MGQLETGKEELVPLINSDVQITCVPISHKSYLVHFVWNEGKEDKNRYLRRLIDVHQSRKSDFLMS